MKSRIKPILFILLIAGVIAAQSCKLLFKSDYAELKADDLTAFVESRFPEMQKRQLAQNQQARKSFIDNFKKMFAFAQAAEDAGLHKSETFKKQLEFTMEQLLASEYGKRNPEVIVSKEEWEAYYASHKDQFESHLNLINTFRKQPVNDAQKEQHRAFWSEVKLRGDKARQANLDKDPGFKILLRFARADLLANLYTQSLKEKNKLTDAEKRKFLADNPGADPDKQKEKAQGLLDRVKNGENFEKLADDYTEDPSGKGKGGDLGWFGKGIMDPTFEAAAFALQKGQTSNELVKSAFGYHIIRVDDRRMSSPPAPATAGPSPAPEPKQEPQEEVHARHILIDTRVLDQYEAQTTDEKVKRELEDATLKFPVSAPADFTLNIAGIDRNRIPGVGGGQGGQMRRINPEENK
ncbi:MAG TPA: peptidylprolyl isomerase [Blastocatellia bacterium]|nr:peptidylprolyl isomerase [Blastocatellia bacterium]